MLSKTEGWYSLARNREVFFPAPILILLKDFNCSLTECETIAMMAVVMSAQNLLFWVEQIPQMRKMPQVLKFNEPVTVKLNRKSLQLSNTKAIAKAKI